MAAAGFKGNVRLFFVFFFLLPGQTLLGGPILKGEISFQFFLNLWVDWVGT